MSTVNLGGGHCCVCNRVCHHIGGPWFCDEHKSDAAAITPHLAPARADEDFTDRLKRRMREDQPLLARIGAKPCPSKFTAVLGFTQPTEIPCGLVAGHSGNHQYAAEWGEDNVSLPLGAP